MTEDSAPPAPKPKRSFWWYLQGRAGQREYWVVVLFIFVLGFLISEVVEAASTGLTVALAFMQVRRLHDFNRTGWWALLAAILPLGALFFWGSLGEDLILLLGFLIQGVLVALIGAIPGTRGDNRFGPPPPFGWRRILTGRPA